MLRVLLCVGLGLASSTSIARGEETSDAVTRAAELLTAWRGDSRNLDDARAILARELQANPDSASALREQARLLTKEGYIIGSRYEPGSLEAAMQSLDRAIELAPTDPASYLLRARIHIGMEHFEDAWTALEAAREVGGDSPEWLLVHSSLLARQERFEESAVLVRKVLKLAGATAAQRSEARNRMIEILLVDKKVEDAYKVYREQLRETPDDAWTHGDYASFLLCWRDDFNSSLTHARAARRLMDYPAVQSVEIAALLRLWAQQALDGETEDAQTTWMHMGAGPDANIASLVSYHCGGNRVTNAVLKAMLETGFGARIPAPFAPIVAADQAPNSVPGVFVLNVQATGRSEGDIFLNSETDYRDPRNLSVRILPKAQDELRTKYGDDFEAALKGKPIEVMGWAKRTKIIFSANGEDTGKFYYQTHVVMHSADQIQRLEDKPARPNLRKKLEDRGLDT